MSDAALPARLSRRAGGALLIVDLSPPETIRLFGEEWPAKKEFHVTLLGREGLGNLLRDIGRLRIIRAEVAISRSAAEVNWKVRPTGEYWRLDDGDERSIIEMVEVGGAEAFFTTLEGELETKIERPPYHVTLYMQNTSRGIGLATRADLERLGKKIEGAELEELKRQLGG